MADKEIDTTAVVNETADGAAEVLLPPIPGEGEVVETGAQRVDVRGDDAPADEAADPGEAAELAAATDDAEREAIRARRRDERRLKKERQRAAMQQKDTKIQQLEKTVYDLLNWRGSVESRGFAADMARIDTGIQQARAAEVEAKAAMEEAVATQNGKAMAEAQELWYEARRRADGLEGMKVRLGRAAQVEMQRAGAQRQATAQVQRQPTIEPEVREHGSAWMSRHKWYDPQGSNQDSRVALAVDSQLAEDGFDPKTPEYWAELDNRLKGYLPHRYAGYNAQEGQAGGTGMQAGGRVGVTTTGPGRTAGPGTAKFTLSRERVEAMKEAGIWDDPAKRDSMIRRYREHDLRQKASSKGT